MGLMILPLLLVGLMELLELLSLRERWGSSGICSNHATAVMFCGSAES
jgi:hypothetical protein